MLMETFTLDLNWGVSLNFGLGFKKACRNLTFWVSQNLHSATLEK